MRNSTINSNLRSQLELVSFATLGHFLEEGFVDFTIRAMLPNIKVIGRAVTLQLFEPDALAVNQALANLFPGDVLVIDMNGDHTHAPVGAVTACAALCAGAHAIIIDGVVTDILDLNRTGLPIFARGTSQLTTKRIGSGRSQFNVSVQCGGAVCKAGDIVLADDNGILFLDDDTAERVIALALQSDENEPIILKRLRAGESVAQVLTNKI